MNRYKQLRDRIVAYAIREQEIRCRIAKIEFVYPSCERRDALHAEYNGHRGSTNCYFPDGDRRSNKDYVPPDDPCPGCVARKRLWNEVRKLRREAGVCRASITRAARELCGVVMPPKRRLDDDAPERVPF